MSLYSPYRIYFKLGKRKVNLESALGLGKFFCVCVFKFLSQSENEPPLHSLVSTCHLKTTSPIKPASGNHHLGIP